MDTLTYVLIAFTLFFIVRSLFADRTPIPESSVKVHKPQNQVELDTLLASTRFALVDFYADWCPPCRAIAPIFSQLADTHASPGKLEFAKVNVDHVQDIAGRYGVSAMPTFVVFADGKPGGVAVDGLKGRGSVVVNSEGVVERVRGADKPAIEAVVAALVAAAERRKE